MSNFFTFDRNQAGDFSPLEPAEYECMITEAKPTTSSTGNPMIKVTLTVRPDVEQDGAKRKIFDNIVFTEKAMFKAHQLAGAIGVASAESIEEYAQQLYAKPVRVKTKNEEYNGKINPKVDRYMRSELEGNDELMPSSGSDPFSGATDINPDDLPF